MNNPEAATLVSIERLRMYFPVTQGLLRRKVADVKAVDDVSFSVRKGETLGLVGESGCGKTTVGRCILRLYKPNAGRILFEGRDIAGIPEKAIKPFRSKIQLIFQDPFGSLDPRQCARSIVSEPIKINQKLSRGEREDRVAELFRTTGLDPNMGDRYPHEFSGGQRQRLGIARALACNPSFIVCDEPISALDVSIQAQIMKLLKELQGEFGLTYLYIAHDLAVVRHVSDRVAVMYLGKIVEITDAASLYDNPLHPYTQALLSGVPIPDPRVERSRERIILKGDVPSPIHPPSGCAFHPRCFMATPDCREQTPELRDAGADHHVACIRV